MAANLSNSDRTVGVTQLGYLGFGVSDIEAWKEFSSDVLGFQHNGGAEGGAVFLRLDDNHHRIVLVPSGEDDLIFQGWEVKDEAALEQMANQLRAFGIEASAGTREDAAERMVVDLIRFKDPDGIQTEIYYGPLLDHRPFVSPRGVKGFNAGGLGLGHSVLAVADPKEYLRFLTEVLGARISDHIQIAHGPVSFNLTFLHVNPRHHSVAVAPRPPSRDGAPSKRLHHFMVELNDLDDVGFAHSLFQQRGIPVGGLGRHTNDRMLSFYGETPSGFDVEYGWNGLLIMDEDTWEVKQHRAPSLWGHGMPQPSPAPPTSQGRPAQADLEGPR